MRSRFPMEQRLSGASPQIRLADRPLPDATDEFQPCTTAFPRPIAFDGQTIRDLPSATNISPVLASGTGHGDVGLAGRLANA